MGIPQLKSTATARPQVAPPQVATPRLRVAGGSTAPLARTSTPVAPAVPARVAPARVALSTPVPAAPVLASRCAYDVVDAPAEIPAASHADEALAARVGEAAQTVLARTGTPARIDAAALAPALLRLGERRGDRLSPRSGDVLPRESFHAAQALRRGSSTPEARALAAMDLLAGF